MTVQPLLPYVGGCVSCVKSGWAPYTHEAALIWQLGKLLSVRTEAPGHMRDDHAHKGSLKFNCEGILCSDPCVFCGVEHLPIFLHPQKR